ncbi:MAG: rod shape-determining protein MreD [Pseudomonadota bacterium]
MAERVRGIWRYRALFVGLAAIVGFVQLLPINVPTDRLPGPDILLLIALSWTVRRPVFLPILLVAAVFLVADLLFMRPPGLWTALVVLGCEFLRSRRILLKNASFMVEWLLVAGVIGAMTVANAMMLGLFSVPQPSAGAIVIRMFFTIICYPLVVILAGRAFGLTASKQEGLGGI